MCQQARQSAWRKCASAAACNRLILLTINIPGWARTRDGRQQARGTRRNHTHTYSHRAERRVQIMITSARVRVRERRADTAAEKNRINGLRAHIQK